MWIQASSYAEEMQSKLKHMFEGLTYTVSGKLCQIKFVPTSLHR